MGEAGCGQKWEIPMPTAPEHHEQVIRDLIKRDEPSLRGDVGLGNERIWSTIPRGM